MAGGKKKIEYKGRRSVKGAVALCVASILPASLLFETHAWQQGSQGGSQQKPAGGASDVVSLSAALVTVPVRVTDGKGNEVAGLKHDDFELYEDGVRQPIEFFSAEDQPITLGLVIDKSRSMGDEQKVSHVHEAAADILRLTHPENELFYLTFDEQAYLVEDFTTDRERILSAIEDTKPEGGTSLYDAVIESLQHLASGRYTRQALVVVSDGLDQHSAHTLAEVLGAVERSVAQVYFIGFYSQAEQIVFQNSGPSIMLPDGRHVDNPRYALKRLAKESGAEVYFPKSARELQSVAERIARDLRRQYLLAYYPPSQGEKDRYRPISVKVHNPQFAIVTVRARQGYRIGTLEPQSEEVKTQVAGTTKLPDLSSFYKIVPAEATTEPAKAADPALGPPAGNATNSYKDDFSDPASGWPNTASAFYRNGMYHLKEKGTVLVHGPLFRDFQAEVTVQFFDGPSSRWGGSIWQFNSPGAGMVFRLNEDGYYAFYVGIPPGSPKAHYKLIKRISGQDVELVRWTFSDVSGRKARLGVRCNGNVIELYVQNRLAKRVVDSDFRDGFVGLILTDKGEAAFDDLRARSLQ